MLDVFASIGLGMLIPALGLRKKTKEYVEVKHLDEDKSGCYSCTAYRGGDNEKCASCPNRVYYSETRIRYINEPSRYEEQQPLKKYAILLYMLLHGMSPDSNGFVRKVDTEEAASILSCSQRTVVNNLHLLDKAGYITAAKTDIPGYYQVFLTGYKDIFRPAKEGGRGFLRVGCDFISQMTELPDTNAIRLAVRSYLSCVDAENHPQADREKSMHEIKSQLPEYVTKKKIAFIFDNPAFRKMFSVTQKRRSAIVIVMPEFDQAKVAEKVKEQCGEEIRKAIDAVNRDAKGKKKQKKAYPLHLTEREVTDIKNIALKIPIRSVIEGLIHFYHTYIERDLYYENAGALVRTYASDHMRYGFIT